MLIMKNILQYIHLSLHFQLAGAIVVFHGMFDEITCHYNVIGIDVCNTFHTTMKTSPNAQD